MAKGVVGTCDTKDDEFVYVRDLIAVAGVPTLAGQLHMERMATEIALTEQTRRFKMLRF
jgi:uncharacterized protein (UPF0261 family)